MKKFIAFVVFALVIAHFGAAALHAGTASIESRADRIEAALNAAN